MTEPKWEVIELPKLWSEMTDDDRAKAELLMQGLAPVTRMSRDEIEALYGQPVDPV